MQHIDIADLVRKALIVCGCDESILGDFDGHSTISLDFENSPSLLISVVDDYVWLWTRLIEEPDSCLAQRSSPLLEKIQEGCNCALPGQPQLAKEDNFLILKVLVHPSYLETPELFAEALNEFFEISDSCLKIII